MRVLAEENKPISLIRLRKLLRCREAALQDVVDVLVYEGLLESHCFRDYIYVTLNLPLFGTNQFHAYQKYNSLLFEIEHYRGLTKKLTRMSEELRILSEKLNNETSSQ